MTPDEVRLPALGALGWARWAWRQLTSMRTALLLLLLLAVAAVPGSVFPQRRIDPGRVQAYLTEHPGAGPVLDRLGMFDVYTSPWFSAVYLLLFVSLVGCVLPRSRQHLRAIRQPPPRTPSRLDRLPASVSVTVDADPQVVLAAARTVLRRNRYRVADHPDSVAAEKGYLAETGNLVFHLALLGLLLTVAAGSYLGYSGQVIVVEGHSFADVLPSYGSFSSGQWVDSGALPPFSFTLDSLKVRFELSPGGQLGAPRQFDASLTVRDTPEAAPRSVVVSPNQPLDVNGPRVFLVGNGYAPTITVRDAQGRVVFQDAVTALPTDASYLSNVVVKVPDAGPRQLALVGQLFPTYSAENGRPPVSLFPDAINPRLTLTAFVSAPGQDGLGVNAGVPQSVFAPDVSRMQQLADSTGSAFRVLLAPGETTTLPDGAGSVTFEKLSRFAAFDVRYDPTKGWALTTAVLSLAGVTVSLFVRRRRAWVRVGPNSADPQGGTLVQVAGLARGDDPGLARDVEALAAAIRAATGGTGHDGAGSTSQTSTTDSTSTGSTRG